MVEASKDALFRSTAFYVSILICAFTHILLLLNQGVYWDDHTLFEVIKAQDQKHLQQWFNDSGLQSFYYIHWFLGSFQHFVFAHKMGTFLSLLGITAATFVLCQRYFRFTPIESVFVSLLATISAASNAYVSMILVAYTFHIFLFTLGMLLYFEARLSQKYRLPLYAIGSLLFFVSFFYKALIVGYFFFALVFVFQNWSAKRRSFGRPANELDFSRDSLVYLIKHLPLLLVLPVFNVFLLKWLYPAKGYFDGYHDPFLLFRKFDAAKALSQVFICIAAAIKNSILLQPIVFGLSLIDHILLALIAVPLLYLYLRKHPLDVRVSVKNNIALMIFCLFAIVLLLLPFGLVEQTTGLIGRSTKNAGVILLPTAILVLVFLRLVGKKSLQLASALMAFTIVGSSFATIDYYLHWQARWAKDQALYENFKRTDRSENLSLLYVKDNVHLGLESIYRTGDWSGLLKRASGKEKYLVFEPRAYNYQLNNTVNTEQLAYLLFQEMTKNLNRKFGLARDVNVFGCQGNLSIKPGPWLQAIHENTPSLLRFSYLGGDKVMSILAKLKKNITTSPYFKDAYAISFHYFKSMLMGEKQTFLQNLIQIDVSQEACPIQFLKYAPYGFFSEAPEEYEQWWNENKQSWDTN